MWHFDWLCYLRLFGDCRSFFGRPCTPQTPSSIHDTNLAATSLSNDLIPLKIQPSKVSQTIIIENPLENFVSSSINDIFSGEMDTNEFRKRGRQMVDYIADYLETISHRRVTPNVEPGYLKELLPQTAPIKSEDWETIMKDFEKFIMPGVTHWQHPRFHAYFPAGNSYPSILADMLSDAIGCVGFSWVSFNHIHYYDLPFANKLHHILLFFIFSPYEYTYLCTIKPASWNTFGTERAVPFSKVFQFAGVLLM